VSKTSIPANDNHRRPQCGITMTALQHWMELRRTLVFGAGVLPKSHRFLNREGTSRRNILTVAANDQSAHARHDVGFRISRQVDALKRSLGISRAMALCPNCGGGFVPRPVRPATEWRPGVSVEKRPPSTKRIHLSYSLDDITSHTARIKDIPPEER
jgi:hypothetical protein